MRPIDADALTEDFLNDYYNYVMEGLRGNFHDTIRITDVIERINDEPTLDYKPVVYCKDCKYRKEHHYEDDGEPPYIKYSCKFTNYSMPDMGYCSMGKKDGEEREQDQRQVKTKV